MELAFSFCYVYNIIETWGDLKCIKRCDVNGIHEKGSGLLNIGFGLIVDMDMIDLIYVKYSASVVVLDVV
jgi:hypothetical protein